MDRILEVRLSQQDHDSLKRAAVALNLTSKSVLVRAFAEAVGRKTVQELRRFLFFD